MPNRGYVTTPDLLPDLEAELHRRGVPYRIVSEPEPLPTKSRGPRLVLVTDKPKPPGWTRFGRCRRCNTPNYLAPSGVVSTGCDGCPSDWKPSPEAAERRWWEWKEDQTPIAELGLPDWLVRDMGHVRSSDTALSSGTVGALRRSLQERSLRGIGPEREIIVAEALRLWRERVEAEREKSCGGP